jgi:hypothetical protein
VPILSPPSTFHALQKNPIHPPHGSPSVVVNLLPQFNGFPAFNPKRKMTKVLPVNFTTDYPDFD